MIKQKIILVFILVHSGPLKSILNSSLTHWPELWPSKAAMNLIMSLCCCELNASEAWAYHTRASPCESSSRVLLECEPSPCSSVLWKASLTEVSAWLAMVFTCFDLGVQERGHERPFPPSWMCVLVNQMPAEPEAMTVRSCHCLTTSPQTWT